MSYCKAYITDTSILSKEELFRQAYSLMSDERKNRIDKYKFEEGKLLSLGAGLMLRQSCLDAGFDPKEPIAITSLGKPEFIKHSNLHFSISHSGKYALCVISDCNIGCDIQIIEKAKLNIASRFFSEEEKKEIDNCQNQDEKELLFNKLWTLKESFVKALGKGIDDDFSKFSIICNDGIYVKQNFNNKSYSFGCIDFDKDYFASYCIESEEVAELSKDFYLTEEKIIKVLYE